MNEKPPEQNESPEFWEKQLREAGLGPLPMGEVIPAQRETDTPTINYEQEALAKALESEILRFSQLDQDTQNNIINSLRERALQGMNYAEITDRLRQYLDGVKKLTEMGAEDSDVHYTPQKTPEKIKLDNESEKIDEIIAENVSELLKKLEEMRRRGIEKAGRPMNNPADPKELEDTPPTTDLIQ